MANAGAADITEVVPTLLGFESLAAGANKEQIFDAGDLKWQADKEFKPDKEASWKHPAEKDGWILAHNSLRNEISDVKTAIEEVVKRGELNPWEIRALQTIWKEHLAHVHAHHSNEENWMFPFLSKRIKLPEKMAADHGELMEQADLIEKLVSGSWFLTSADELKTAWEKYQEMMLPHLEEEELIALPLMRAYFTPGEITPVVQKMLAKGPPVEIGSFIHHMGDKAFFDFMKQEKIPSFVWYLEFKGKRDRFRKLVVQNVDALISGTPVSKPSMFGKCCK